MSKRLHIKDIKIAQSYTPIISYPAGSFVHYKRVNSEPSKGDSIIYVVIKSGQGCHIIRTPPKDDGTYITRNADFANLILIMSADNMSGISTLRSVVPS